jgi:TolA-binding protein
VIAIDGNELLPRIQGVLQVSAIPAIKNMMTTLNEQIEEFENSINSLNSRLEELENKKVNATTRLKEIEFPFGSIPVNRNESILFFPLGISIDFWISATILGETLQLRKRYHNLIREDKTNSNAGKGVTNKQEEENKEKDTKEKEINKHLSLLFPIWIDPRTGLLIRAIKLAILSVQLIIFGVTLYFLYDSWNHK